jgi:predicted metal-dependent HD superfamily phosphohydrolase
MFTTPHQTIAIIAGNGLPNEPTHELLAGLQSRYDKPWRHYHTATHITELFVTLNRHIQHIEDPRTMGWAMLYHDAIYDPTAAAGRNEELSAQLAAGQLSEILPPHQVEKVAVFTRATASHGPVDGDDDLNFFLDADLAILGASPQRYTEYASQIRAEYAHVPSDIYKAARISVLQGLASRVGQSSLFRTTLLRDIYEQPAHQNIAYEIESLS